jgi:hypothetical protein
MPVTSTYCPEGSTKDSGAAVQTAVALHSLSMIASVSVARRTLFEFHLAVLSVKSAAPEQVSSLLANTARYKRPR